MIASVRGIIRFIGADHAVIETGGIGYLVYAPRPVLERLGAVGDEAHLHTLMIVREDSLSLYGFTTPEQRVLFETLLGVTGIGPRVALNVLSAITPDELRLVVAQKDATRLARVPGIGKKTAERLILELQGKLDLKGLPTITPAEAPPAIYSINNELADLLVSLGYSSAEASAAIAALPADAPTDLEERLRLALRYFGGA